MPNNNCELHSNPKSAIGYSMNSSGNYSTYAPNCKCIYEGDFDSIGFEDSDTESALKDGYNSVDKLGLWDWFRRPDIPGHGGFVFSDHEELKMISREMTHQGHSGTSFAFVMRIMQNIAVHGWDIYVDECLSSLTRARVSKVRKMK